MYISFMCLFFHLLNIGLTILCDRYSVGADGGVVVSLCDEGFVADVSARSLGEAVLSFPWGSSWTWGFESPNSPLVELYL